MNRRIGVIGVSSVCWWQLFLFPLPPWPSRKIAPCRSFARRGAAYGRMSEPGKGDRFQPVARVCKCAKGIRSVYDVESATALRHARRRHADLRRTISDTRLDVGLIKIQPGDDASEDGFDCDAHVDRPGAEQAAAGAGSRHARPAPIPAKHTALIRLDYVDGMDKESCPAIVCCGGRMDFHGARHEPHLGQARRHRQEGRQHRHPGRSRSPAGRSAIASSSRPRRGRTSSGNARSGRQHPKARPQSEAHHQGHRRHQADARAAAGVRAPGRRATTAARSPT